MSEWITGNGVKRIPPEKWDAMARYFGWTVARIAELEAGREPPAESAQALLCAFARSLDDDQAERGLRMLKDAFSPRITERKKVRRGISG